jgi:hypothetical protein
MQKYHMRQAPVDPRDKNKGAKIGDDGELYYPQFGDLKPRVMKERMTFAGGFKIIEGEQKKEITQYLEESEEEAIPSQNTSGVITREMVLKQLNLEAAVPTVTSKEGLMVAEQMNRANLSKTIIEDLNKEITKLQRQKEIMDKKKEYLTTGEIKADETDEMKGYKIKRALEEEEGANVLHADPSRIQFQRHQTGQLGGLGEITLEEVQELRKQTQNRLIDIEEQYLKYKSAKELGSVIMEKFFPNLRKAEQEEDEEFETAKFNPNEIIKEPDFVYKDFSKGNAKSKLDQHKSKNKFGDKTKPYYMQGVPSKSQPKIGRFKEEFQKENQVNNATKDLWNAPTFYSKTGKPKNSHDAAYEAKFKRYLYNKHQKKKYDEKRQKDKKREYDTWMYGPSSPHKDAKKIDWEGTDVYKKLHFSGEKLEDQSVDDEELLREGLEQNKSSLEVMSKQDEIIFNILKWIFSAIKKEKEVVEKTKVLEQLKDNSDTIKSLGFVNFQEFEFELKEFRTQQEGMMSWEEFIDFFITKSGLGDQKSDWWRTFLNDMDRKEQEKKEIEFYNSPGQKSKRLNEKAFNKSSEKIGFEINEEKKDQFKKLNDSRVDQIKAKVNDDQAKEGYDTAADELDIFKNRPKCLLLDSHVALLDELFTTMDKYDDFILIRRDFLHALRNDDRIKMFLHQPAVQLPKNRKKITFDEVL